MKDFAFIVHSRDRTDLPRKFPILKFLPNYFFDILTKILPPIVVSNIDGLITKEGKESKGIIIGVPMTAHQLLENRELAIKKIIRAVMIAKNRGARYVGLGAMTASLTKGGLDIIKSVPDIYITTGRTYTVKNITDYIFYCMDKFNLSKEKVRIGIVGAAGGIGSGVATVLARNNFKHFVLIDLERKLTHLKEKIKSLELDSLKLTIEISHQVNLVSSCDIIIAATSAPEVVIKSDDVSPGSIIINDAQPSDISPDIIKYRKDVLVIEGGVLNAPSINCNFNMGLKHRNDIFSCLAETLLLTYNNENRHYSIDDINLKFLDELSFLGKKLDFNINNMQNSEGKISDFFLKRFTDFIINRNLNK